MHGSTPLVRRSLRRSVGVSMIGAVTAFGLVGCGPATSEITVSDAAVPVPASADTAAAYLKITNHGGLADELLSVSTPSAKLTHLHESSVDAEGRATMKAVGTLKIPADSTVELTPGGLHLMLSQPQSLAKGDTVELTLKFRHAGTKKVDARVIDDISEVIGS